MKFKLSTLFLAVLVVACAAMAAWHYSTRPRIIHALKGDYEWRNYEAFDSHYSLQDPGKPTESLPSLTWYSIPEETYQRLRSVSMSKHFSPRPSTAEEWRENELLLTGIYSESWHGFVKVRRIRAYEIANLDIDHNLPPRRLMAIRKEEPVLQIGGHKAFDEWSYSWVDIDSDLTVYNPRQEDEIIGTFERPLENGNGTWIGSEVSISLPEGVENSTVHGVTVIGKYSNEPKEPTP